jgi:hypothetical protein
LISNFFLRRLPFQLTAFDFWQTTKKLRAENFCAIKGRSKGDFWDSRANFLVYRLLKMLRIDNGTNFSCRI